MLSPENNRLFLSALRGTIYNSRIPQGVSSRVPVAHKTGSKSGVYNDAALVLLPDNPYVLVILTRGVPESAEQLMRQVSRDLYLYEEHRLQNGWSEWAKQLSKRLPAR